MSRLSLGTLTGWRRWPRPGDVGDAFDRGQKESRTLEPCRNIIGGKQASNKKLSEDPPLLLLQYTMRLIYWKETDKTTHVSLVRCALLQNMSVRKHPRLKIDFHSWPFHFVGKVPGKISAAHWLVKVISEMTVGIALTRKAGGLAKNRVRVCAQELMIAFPQHCIVSREGGSSVFFMGTDSVQSRSLSLKANDLESEKVALNKRRGRKNNWSKTGENNSLREMKHGRCKRGS